MISGQKAHKPKTLDFSRVFSVFCASFEIHTSRQTIIDFLSKPGLEPGKRLEVKIFEDKSAVFSY